MIPTKIFFNGALKQRVTCLTLLSLMCIAAWSAWTNHFIQDDAFITFRYAAHFAQGQGLVWYPGSSEFGFTNFLFALAIGVLIKLGLAAETASYLISITAYFLSLGLVFLIARRTAASPLTGYLCCLLLATNPTYSGYATGGMETSLQTVLVLAAYYQLLRFRDTQDGNAAWLMGAFSALVLLTRLDSALLLFPAYLFLAMLLAARVRTAVIPAKTAARWLAITTLVPSLSVAALLLFCHAYYGYALPNTFLAKIDTAWHSAQGIQYLLSYISTQGTMPLYMVAAAVVMAPWERRRWDYVLLWGIVLIIWMAYILYIGGDFMDYRLLVPVLPFFMLLTFDLMLGSGTKWRIGIAVMATAAGLYGSVLQERNRGWLPAGVQSLHMLDEWIMGPPVGWIKIGKALHKLFYTGQLNDVHIAASPTGAIPYYSGLPTLDELGLNTRDVLIHGDHVGDYPGHRFHASTPYMVQAGVNLMFGHPVYFCKENAQFNCSAGPTGVPGREPGLRALLVPVDESCYVVAYYLNPHDGVDKLIRQGDILEFTQVQNRAHCDHW